MDLGGVYTRGEVNLKAVRKFMLCLQKYHECIEFTATAISRRS